ncbi:MAG: UDP-glucose 4-epimerase GalE [Pirellulales bacterium]|nr:UDP-glucose 4-epimerase GalE [Pirellulales bacterium]
MNLLVTGGSGYIGSHAVRLLARGGHEIWIYDDCLRGHRAAVPRGRLIEGEVGDRASIERVLRERRIDAVLHFAGVALVGESMARPDFYERKNLHASAVMFEAMESVGVRQIVFSSTTATYGAPEQMPISEDTPQRPINPYGATKLAVERLLEERCRRDGWAAFALRYFNAAGATPAGDLGEDHDPETHLIPLVLQVALGQRPRITVFGDDYPTPDGTCVRDYVHVDDLARAHAAALDRLRPGDFQACNLGSGCGHSVREVIEACRRATGRAIAEEIGPRREGDPPVLYADIRRAQCVLGWQPEYTDLEAICATAWNWHRTHPKGFDDRGA